MWSSKCIAYTNPNVQNLISILNIEIKHVQNNIMIQLKIKCHCQMELLQYWGVVTVYNQMNTSDLIKLSSLLAQRARKTWAFIIFGYDLVPKMTIFSRLVRHVYLFDSQWLFWVILTNILKCLTNENIDKSYRASPTHVSVFRNRGMNFVSWLFLYCKQC